MINGRLELLLLEPDGVVVLAEPEGVPTGGLTGGGVFVRVFLQDWIFFFVIFLLDLLERYVRHMSLRVVHTYGFVRCSYNNAACAHAQKIILTRRRNKKILLNKKTDKIMIRAETINIEARLPRPGRTVNRFQFDSWRVAVAEHRWRGYGLERIHRMIEKLVQLEPAVLPLDSKAKLEYAIQTLLCKGGRNGNVACESLIYDFRNAIEYWHFVNFEEHIPLDNFMSLTYFKALPHMRNKLPKNITYDSNASHGHLQMPSTVWWSTVMFWLRKNATYPKHEALAAKRDTIMLILMWVMFRRQGDIFLMTRDVLTDKGKGNGFTWVVLEHKTAKDGSRLVLPIPEYAGDVPVAQTLREFLEIAPPTGFIFRSTTNHGTAWEPPSSTKFVRNQGYVEVWEGYTSGAWNADLQRRVRTACPWYDGEVRMLTAHTIRGGATVTAAEAGVPLPTVRAMLSHQSEQAILSYTRLTQGQLQTAYQGPSFSGQ